MLVHPDAAAKILDLYHQLLYFAGQRDKVLSKKLTYKKFLDKPLQIKADCRDSIYEPTPLFDDFLEVQGEQLSPEDRAIVAGWKRYVRGTFVVLKHLKKHTIFLSGEEETRAYAVLGLTTDLSELLPSHVLPTYIETVLLPYKGVIVCDGILRGYNLLIGPNMTRDLKAEYQDIKKAGKVITTL